MASEVRFNGTLADLMDLFHGIAEALSGEPVSAFKPYADGVCLRISMALLSQVQQAFVVKSRGGTGSDNIKWPPLKRETIAQRRTTKSELKSIGITGQRVRGFLTPAENDRWKAIFRSVYARRALELGDAAAKAKAGATAWAILKSEGAQTKLDLLGGRTVDILRDTSMLLRSLSPLSPGQPPAEGQIIRIADGAIAVGSSLKPWHHEGIPGRLPARPFWPVDGSIPPVWWDAIMVAAGNGLRESLEMIVRNGRA